MTATQSGGGRRRRRLRIGLRGVRARVPTPTHGESDSEVLGLVSDPYTAVGETHERLRALLSAFEERADRRAVFLSIYARMTGAVARRVQRGEFADPDWVSAYLVAFANRYRVAVRDYETGAFDSLATPWLLAFEAAQGGESLVVQDAALGVNAHINYDLALALDDVGVGPNREGRYRDHCTVIDVIADLVDETQRSLASREAAGLATLDAALGRLDERLTVFAIDECRESAWRTAVALDSRCRLRRRFARWINDATATGAAHIIRSAGSDDTFGGAFATL